METVIDYINGNGGVVSYDALLTKFSLNTVKQNKKRGNIVSCFAGGNKHVISTDVAAKYIASTNTINIGDNQYFIRTAHKILLLIDRKSQSKAAVRALMNVVKTKTDEGEKFFEAPYMDDDLKYSYVSGWVMNSKQIELLNEAYHQHGGAGK